MANLLPSDVTDDWVEGALRGSGVFEPDAVAAGSGRELFLGEAGWGWPDGGDSGADLP